MESSDDQSREWITKLLHPHETIRDPVHGDIWITALERKLIDTSAFQRMRRIAQLGPTSLVYHGATHSRFAHSIGTVHTLQQLVDVVNRNAAIYPEVYMMKVDDRAHLVARLMALLHDVAHIPFGHTLEDEGNLYDPEWADKQRVSLWLGEESEIGRALYQFCSWNGCDVEFSAQLLADVRDHISAKRKDFGSLKFPFVADLVGNTLCADLLDYVERDMYYCGLKERGGDRFINYVSVLRIVPTEHENGENLPGHFVIDSGEKKEGSGRVVLLAYRRERDHEETRDPRLVVKRDVLSEAFDLLRRRFSLAEKVYFHRSKEAASSILISAVGAAGLKASDLAQSSDESVVDLLLSCGNARASAFARAYRDRQLFKPLFKLEYRKEEDISNPNTAKLWHQVYPRFRSPSDRAAAEERLETELELPPGSVSIYCPDRDMNLKRFEMLVQIRPDQEIKTLGSILDDTRKKEMDALETRFQELWSLQVFVNPEVLNPLEVSNPRVMLANGLCESSDMFDLPNDIEQLRGRGASHLETLVEQAALAWDTEHPNDLIPHQMVNEMQLSSSWRTGAPETIEEATHELARRMKERTSMGDN